MQISTTARHCELNDETRAFVDQRLGRFEKYARDIHEVHLIVTAEKYRYTAEITVRLKGRRELVSREEATEPRVAIDQAADNIERQLRRLKEKRVDRKRHAKPLNGRDVSEGVASETFEFEEEPEG